MIAPSGSGPFQLKVLDFGLAKLSEPSPMEVTTSEDITKGSIIGTAAYMSPEQAEGKSVDARSDIFSFGSVLYEMLSGRRAFQRESNLAVLIAVLRETPDPIPGVPPNLQTIVSRCLQKNPELRYPNALELKMALQACTPLSAAFPSPAKTIVVLPFANLSGDIEQEYFSDGLTEEMISALTRSTGLRVTARTSAFALRSKNLDVREIGARLNVEYILEGSVRRSGNRVRITAQLVNATEGCPLWSERYDREIRDVLDIQEEISRSIVKTLRVHLARETPLVKRHTSSPEAYSLYLRGRYHQEKKTPEGLSRAKQCFEEALAADPNYAMAHLGLADFHWQNAFYGFQYPKEAIARAKEAATHALEIDDAIAEGQALLGTLLGVGDCDWRAANLAFQRALELDANSPWVLFRYSKDYLWPQGKIEEAVAAIERALSLDPLWILGNWALAYFIYAVRRYDRAVKHLLAVVEMDPACYLAYCVLGLAYAQQGMLHEAVVSLEKACEFAPGNPLTLGMLAYGLGKAGQKDHAMDILEKLQAAEQNSYVPAKALMFAHAGLGNASKVLGYAEKSLDDRDPMTVMCLRQEPVLDIVRHDSRYKALLRKINLAA